jgi:hypothetical protein
MENSDISILICGPLHKCGLEAIPYYLSTSVKVVYSTWKPSNDDEILLLDKITRMLPSENIVISDYADLPSFQDNKQNIYYQMCTWDKAVEICTTPYCVKIRSNCAYNNIDKLFKSMKDNPDKIISASCFFRPVYMYPYHPSDFILGMKTIEAKNITINLLKQLEERANGDTPEQKICLTILNYRNIAGSGIPDIVKQHMRDIFTIVNVNDLSPILYWVNDGPYTYFDHTLDNFTNSITSTDFIPV